MHCNVVKKIKKSRFVADSLRNFAGKFAVSRSLSSSIFSSKDIECLDISAVYFFLRFTFMPHCGRIPMWDRRVSEKEKKSEQKQRAMVSFSRLERSRERQWKKYSAQVSRLGRGELNIFTTEALAARVSWARLSVTSDRSRTSKTFMNNFSIAQVSFQENFVSSGRLLWASSVGWMENWTLFLFPLYSEETWTSINLPR